MNLSTCFFLLTPLSIGKPYKKESSTRDHCAQRCSLQLLKHDIHDSAQGASIPSVMTLHCLFWPYTLQSKHLFNFPLIHKNLYDIYTFRGDFSLSFHTFRGDFLLQRYTFRGDFIWIHDNILVDLTKINQDGSEDITSIYITLCLSLCDANNCKAGCDLHPAFSIKTR